MTRMAEAAAVVVAEDVWKELGQPPAMRLMASASLGVAPEEEIEAPIAAMRLLLGRTKAVTAPDIEVIELGESSAAQAMARCQGSAAPASGKVLTAT